jgi:hypothetical protein
LLGSVSSSLGFAPISLESLESHAHITASVHRLPDQQTKNSAEPSRRLRYWPPGSADGLSVATQLAHTAPKRS